VAGSNKKPIGKVLSLALAFSEFNKNMEDTWIFAKRCNIACMHRQNISVLKNPYFFLVIYESRNAMLVQVVAKKNYILHNKKITESNESGK